MAELTLKEDKAGQVRSAIDECRHKISAIVGKSVVIKLHIKMSHISADSIVQLVCSSIGVRYSDIVSKSRESNVVMARHIIWFLCRNYCGFTDSDNGKLCNRDRTTVIQGLETVQNMIDTGHVTYVSTLREVENRILNLTEDRA